ncbi:blue copper protein-like [Cornus florida]|uniref:blue copper protein-like n=1 Tax=Cornus florida TaxID=4283 RepID=UPI0028A13A6B|nr:blue copper protein-like [Cornus florida]
MASTQIIIITILALITPIFATEFIVGDNDGWKINFDYEAWAMGKMFMVGDTLGPSANEALTTGNDVITLKTPGNKWYICGVGQHCAMGNQKLAITVHESVAPAPMPAGPAPIFATEFIVGDNDGWKINFDYEAWAKGKMFMVGDTLVFKYTEGSHNVFKVNGTGFDQCIKPPANEALTTGNDVITLKTPGNKWYICGVGQHCAMGNQKLAITVHESMAPAPMPAGPISAAATQGMAASRYYGGMVAAAFGILLIVMV